MFTAADRFFTNEHSVPADILQSHSEATYRRLRAVPVVLAVQETTEANGTSFHAPTGVGPLGHSACRGLLVPATVALTPDRVPRGLLAQ